ncbi:MAG: single-stranded DNA-binding protein [Pseudomonadota bacterium]
MSDVNKVILVGRLGADPELRSTPNGKSVCSLSVGTNSQFSDGTGAVQKKVNWHRVVAWGKQAEHCHSYLRRGRQVYVEGRLEHRSYLDKEGNRRFTTEIVSQRVVFLGDGKKDELIESQGVAGTELDMKDALPF